MVWAPHPLNLLSLRYGGGDQPAEALRAALNGTGRVFLTHTRLDGRFVIRVAIGAQATEARHVAGLWELIEQHAPSGARVAPGGPGSYRPGMAGALGLASLWDRLCLSRAFHVGAGYGKKTVSLQVIYS